MWPLLICFICISSQVVEVVSGDCIIVADDAVPYGSPSAERRVNLSSIRAPKMGSPRRDEKPHKFDPEAKDFLRTRLIGKQVRIGGCDNLMKLSNVKIYYSY
jgi:staphylococcal nuclease domain-containing protein 1